MSVRSIYAAVLLAGSSIFAPAEVAQAQNVEAPSPMPALFASEFEMSRDLVDEVMADGIIVPVPKDPGGGYTHEQHKLNFRVMYLAGDLYRITGDEKYRDFVRDMLVEYAEMYPTLGDHPARANQNVGRLFWQVLNDAMWLVHSIQAYESIRDTITDEQRDLIDNQLFRKAAHFMSVDSKRTFNLIHNHATWATAGVGMTGYVLGDQHLVDIALKGSDKTGETGFLRQTELLFSPDGYYAEGPYYQRFALLPFMVFANAINANEPEREIFQHRDGILLKALRTTIELSYAGQFFPFNDALKEKGLKTAELYEGIAVAYAETRDPGLLSIAEWQGRTVLSEAGMLVASDLAAGKAKPFPFKSMLLRDGPEGKQGAVAIMRTPSPDGESMHGQALVTKNSSQGMGHGHFDKLSWQFYDNGYEVVTDYGAARFLNIEAKEGGRYLPENESWAKQTIAHNTLVVDEQSNFNGDVELASAHAPTQDAYVQREGLQLSSGSIDTAFADVAMTRTMALVEMPGSEHPVVVDLLRAASDGEHQYDLPLHYMGQIMRVGFELESFTDTRPVLGKDNGYQHIWVDAQGAPTSSGNAFITWLLDDRFYTARWVPQEGAEAILAESGANDASFNLRREPMLLQRVRIAGGTSFVTLLEPHGKFDGSAERTTLSDSLVASVNHDRVDGADIITITMKNGARRTLAISHNPDDAASHSVIVDETEYRWTGFAAVIGAEGDK
ncbi:alginate lyase family protein [Altererythrobacter sp. RZ02]|uniref:Alginate lyase family protein n=1 Tax=Pontixanthobacter rizhaonensis TaxID=2730337 RepID=A0A848QSA4_9SPHN|nr:heparinase II/III family protein [Pontixanthobacter rizhaonensis]NMW31988.1 alginate lyase family protein [Pontixanthobacter rizhaonensis]